MGTEPGPWVVHQRGGPAAEWVTDNPVLEERQLGWETDTRKVKLGDGVTAWNDLPYAAGTASDVDSVAGVGPVLGDVPEADLKTALNLPTDAATDLTNLDTRVDAVELYESTFGDIVTHNASEFVTQDAYFINVKDHGVAGDGVTDDTAALNAIFAALPAAAGNEQGGGMVFFPKGIYLCNTPVANQLLTITTKPNVTLMGAGKSTILRTTTATANSVLKVDTCTDFGMQGFKVQVNGTAVIDRGIDFTCASPGSVHRSPFRDVVVAANGTYRRAFDMGLTNGSPTVYSAQAVFAAGDVGGKLTINHQSSPFQSTVNSVATITGTLSAGITSSQTSITLNAVLPGAPASNFTILVGSEYMFVTAGGNTTTLTVVRGRGHDIVATAHNLGDPVTTYSATLQDNVTLATTTSPIALGRVEPAGQAHLNYGIGVALDHPGASDMDVAQTSFFNVSAQRCAIAGVAVGNGTSGNVLDQWGYGLSISESFYGLLMNGGAVSVHGGDFSTNIVDLKRLQPVSQDYVFDGIRTEGVGILYEFTGAYTSGRSTRLSDISVQNIHAFDGVPIRHLSSASLLLENIELQASTVGAGTVSIVAQGNTSNPCHMTAINVSTSGGNGTLFAVGLPTCVRTVLSVPRLSTSGVVTANTTIGTVFDNKTQILGGLVKGRTTVADTDYTVLTTDTTVVYTSISAPRVVTLPAQGATLPAGQEFVIKDESGSCSVTKTITITPPAGTIDGAASLVLAGPYAEAVIYSNGTNWFTVSGDDIPRSVIDAKGDLIVGTAADTPTKLAVGANGSQFIPDSTQTSGWRFTTSLLIEGAGDPEGVASAVVGSTYRDTTNGYTYVKQTGSGATGWVGTGTPVPRYAFPSGTYVTPHSVTAAAAMTNNNLRLVPWFCPQTLNVTKIGAEVTIVGEANSKVRLGIYADNGSGAVGALVLDAGQIAGDSATVQDITLGSTLVLPRGWYWLGGAPQAAATTAPTLRVTSGSTANNPGLLFNLGTSTPTAGLGTQAASLTGVSGGLPAWSGIGGASFAPRLHFKLA